MRSCEEKLGRADPFFIGRDAILVRLSIPVTGGPYFGLGENAPSDSVAFDHRAGK